MTTTEIELWNTSVVTEGGCLTGGQFVLDGHFGSQGCVMSDFGWTKSNWNLLYTGYTTKELTPFLL